MTETHYEYFVDPAYYDLWAVRRTDRRSFTEARHVDTEVEARQLAEQLTETDGLNARPQKKDGPAR